MGAGPASVISDIFRVAEDDPVAVLVAKALEELWRGGGWSAKGIGDVLRSLEDLGTADGDEA